MTDAANQCARCGQINPVGAKFCLECGNALTAIGQRVREERKVVSVLFADLVGFTAQAEKMDPEEVRALLQPYHAGVRADLERYGGTVEKFIGDAVVALFGAPVAHEDDPERAVRAALAIRERMRADGRLHVRMGITTGEALVALEARPETGEGMASGDVVNTAARLQAAAPVDGILVDETTYRATARAIDYGQQEPLTVKGKSEPVVVHEVVSARARFGVDVRQGGQAPLVGRLREMELLSGALARALDEQQAQLVTLVGVPGIGKSRVVWELFQRIDAGTRLVSWRQGRSLPYAESISFWALGEIVKAEAGILETDSAADAAAKLKRALQAVIASSEDADWIERHLRPLLGLERENELRGDHRGEAFAAWRQYIEALADQRPLVLVFEDLHWADDGLLDFVDQLVDWASEAALLVIGTARPELLARRPGWGGGKANALTISLAPLSEAETAMLVGNLVERAVMPVAEREVVLERAQGNPLYAEEFARLLADRGRVEDLPESVQGIIAARLDSLSRQQKELLQDAAVVGKVFWGGALASMRGMERAEIEELLHGLERREFVRRERRSSVAGETEYAFRHILVRDVAYGQIPRAERAERHARAAAWLESLGRPADHAELLAQHYLAALELARAAGRSADSYAPRARTALRDAGDRALTLNAFPAAARYYAAALELIAPDDAERPRVLFAYGKALRVAEERGADVLAEAEQALSRAGNLDLAAEAAVLQAELAWFAGDGAATAGHLQRAAQLVDRLGPSSSKAYVLSDLSRYHMLNAETEAAISRGNEALALAEQLGLDEIKVHALINIGSARDFGGDRLGRAELEQAVQLADAINSPEVARALNNLAGSYGSSGDAQRARQLRHEALRKARELGNRSVERFVRPQIISADYDEGAWDSALPALDELIAESQATGGHSQDVWTLSLRARIRLARGDVTGALADAHAALAAGRRAADRQGLVGPLALKGAMLVELDRAEEAMPLFDELVVIPRAGDLLGADAARALVRTGRAADLLRIADDTASGAWQDVFRLVAERRSAAAAEKLESVGYPAHAAPLRLQAAEEFAAAGDVEAARGQLALAAAFWRRVRATRHLAEVQQLEEELARRAALVRLRSAPSTDRLPRRR